MPAPSAATAGSAPNPSMSPRPHPTAYTVYQRRSSLRALEDDIEPGTIAAGILPPVGTKVVELLVAFKKIPDMATVVPS